MPPKDDEDPKSTKEVVTKKQKQMLNREELDLSLIAEAFGGVIMEVDVTSSRTDPITGERILQIIFGGRNKPKPEKKYQGRRVTYGRGGSGSVPVTTGRGDLVRVDVSDLKRATPAPTRQSKSSPTRQPVTPYAPTGPGGQGPTTGGSSAQSGAGRGRSLRAMRILQQPGGTGGRDAGSIARERLNQSKPAPKPTTIKPTVKPTGSGFKPGLPDILYSLSQFQGSTPQSGPAYDKAQKARAVAISQYAAKTGQFGKYVPPLPKVKPTAPKPKINLTKVKEKELEDLKPIKKGKKGTTISVMNPLTGKVEQLTQAEYEKRTGRKTSVKTSLDPIFRTAVPAAAPPQTPPKTPPQPPTNLPITGIPKGGGGDPTRPGRGERPDTKKDRKPRFDFPDQPGGKIGRRQNPQ